jgi:hypothetical protein
MGYYHFSYEQTYRVADSTTYKNGSWANITKGIVVLISGHSDVADTVQFINAASGQHGANVAKCQHLQSAGLR